MIAGCASCAARRPVILNDVGVKNFQRDLTLQGQVTGAPHTAERSLSEKAENFVIVPDRPPDARFVGIGTSRDFPLDGAAWCGARVLQCS